MNLNLKHGDLDRREALRDRLGDARREGIHRPDCSTAQSRQRVVAPMGGYRSSRMAEPIWHSRMERRIEELQAVIGGQAVEIPFLEKRSKT